MTDTKPKHPGGAPRQFDRKAVLMRLCEFMARGDRPLDKICEEEEGFPTSEQIYLWVTKDEELYRIFTHAQELWCWAQRERIIQIADDQSRDISPDGKSDNTAVNRDKLRVAARQWAMAKLAPKLFGDKISQEITGANGTPLIPELNINIKK